jgi:Rps23 Pro-64 3,4-dihydroxylase Tpa1-like proline 4-hydroxylase
MATTLEMALQERSANEPFLNLSRMDGFFEFDTEQCKSAGNALHRQYVRNDPYPHIVIENFVDPNFLRQVQAEFPNPGRGRFADEFSQLKTGYSLDAIRSAYIHDLLRAFNSAAFLSFLEALTGINGLVDDSRFTGGGLHETRRGGHLSIHADFNVHSVTRLRRRINLILFLNDRWDESWGGALELWDQSMAACRRSVPPLISTAVIFNTDGRNYHGHPDPLNTPPEVTRRSIALYYYTAPRGLVVPHTTVFRARPDTAEHGTPILRRLQESARMIMGKRRD